MEDLLLIVFIHVCPPPHQTGLSSRHSYQGYRGRYWSLGTAEVRLLVLLLPLITQVTYEPHC